MFDERIGAGIVFVGGCVFGETARLIKNTIEKGDSVELRLNGVSVLVRDIQATDSGFKGIIYALGNHGLLEFQGLKYYEEIHFEERHIISCSEN